MATEGKARPGPRDDYPFAPDEVPVVEWSGEVERDDGSEEALFAATERRLAAKKKKTRGGAFAENDNDAKRREKIQNVFRNAADAFALFD